VALDLSIVVAVTRDCQERRRLHRCDGEHQHLCRM